MIPEVFSERPFFAAEDSHAALDSLGLDSEVLMVGGDEHTAVSRNIAPSTARRRGPMTRSTVQINGQQMLDVALPFVKHWASEDPTTWFLLYHWSRTEPQVRAELSLPVSDSDDDTVHAWTHRILLPPADLTGSDVELRPDTPQEDVDFRIIEL